jgi:hypothetical protein
MDIKKAGAHISVFSVTNREYGTSPACASGLQGQYSFHGFRNLIPSHPRFSVNVHHDQRR